MDTLTKYNSLVPSLIGRQTNDSLYILFSAILGSILLAISSKIQIPLTPVPVTLQTLVVLVMAMFLGWRAAGAASFLYLAEGAIGLPVFAQGGGLPYLVGPTGGYLFGFLLSSLVLGYLSERGWDRSIILTFFAMTLGTIIIYFIGVSWLAIIKDLNTAIVFGLLPFLTPDILKIFLGTCIISAGWEIRNKYF